MPQINAGEFRKGVKVVIEGDPYNMLECNFVKPGKGQALYKCRLQNLLKNTIIDRTYKSGDGLEAADVRKGEGQFLYRDKDALVFMDQESFEQYHVPQEIMGDAVRWLMDGMICTLMYWNDRIIEVTPPPHVNVKITYTEPAVRGNTSGNITKAAKVETGTEIQVPAFINQGETVRIDTRTGEYVERVKVQQVKNLPHGIRTRLPTARAAIMVPMPDATAHNQKLYIETVGCQMNMLDSELVVAALRKQGYELTNEVSEADTVLFNTCSVREHAEHKIYSALGRLKYSKRRRPNQVIGVIGCMAQKDKTLVFERAPHVDIVVGTGQLAQIPELVEEARAQRRPHLAVSLERRDATRQIVSDSFQSYDPLRDPDMRPSPYQAFVRIMIGCDKFCTYCVVPMTRGPEQSRPPRHIVQEVRQLAGEGVREVTLLGQTVNSYKYTEDGRLFRLSDLIAAFHDTPGLERIKFVTNFPRDMSDDLLQAVRDLPKVARYLHVPAQSGCNDVLKRMKRGYTVEEYREMMARIRETVPDCAVSSDFIVGFCGETDESFEKSMDLVRECRFKNSFIFKYSPRPGTRADELLADDIPEEIKRRRNNEMLALQNEISEEENSRLIGRDFEVLVEGPSKLALKEAGEQGDDAFVGRASQPDREIDHDAAGRPEKAALQLVGRTRCDRIVVFEGNPRLVGSLTKVNIHDCTPTTLIGSIVTREFQHGGETLLPILA